MRSLAIAATVGLLAAAPQDRSLQPDRARELIVKLAAAADDRAREEIAAGFDPFPLTELMRADGIAAREGLAALEAFRRAMPHPSWRFNLSRATIGEARRKQLDLLGPEAGRSRADFTRAALKLLDAKEPETRVLALRLLSGIRVDDPGPLLPLLQDPNRQISSPVTGIVRRSGTPEARKALRARWETARPEVAWEAGQAVADTMSPDEVPALLEQVRADPSRAAAVLPIVERIGDARGEAFVAALLPKLDQNQVYGALEYLASVGGAPAIDAIRAFRDGLPARDPRREWCLHALARLRAPGAAKELLAAVEAGELDLRLYGGRFAALGDASVVPALRTLVEGGKLKIEPKKAAVELIGLLGGAEQVPFLLESMKDEKLAPTAAGALAEIGDPRAAGPLATSLRNSKFDHAFGAALLSLRSIEGAEEALMDILGDPSGHRYVVEPAAQAALRLKSPRPKARVLELLAGKDFGFRPGIPFAVKLGPGFGPGDVAELRKALAGAEEWGRGALCFLLSGLGDEAGARQLVAIVKEDRHSHASEGKPSALCAFSPPPPGLLDEVAARFAKDPKWFDGAEALAYAGKEAGLPRLRESLQREGFEERRAARALLKLGDREAAARLAVQYLAFRSDAEEEALLGPLLDDASAARLREEVWGNLNHGNHPAVRVLAHRRDPAMREHFHIVLRSTGSSNDPHPSSNDPAVALSLARSGDRAAAGIFLRWLRSTSAARRAFAARCLAILKEPGAAAALAPLLDDLESTHRVVRDEDAAGPRRVRDAAVEAIEQLLGRRFEGGPAERAKLAREALRR